MIYLNGGEDLSGCLEKVAKAGGQIIQPKTDIGQGWGFFAHFMDSEGNRMGMWSPA
jgi:predicted enzyme related to lactoylglutathione lyase